MRVEGNDRRGLTATMSGVTQQRSKAFGEVENPGMVRRKQWRVQQHDE